MEIQKKLGLTSFHDGGVPIYEPGLDAVIKSNAEVGRLRFTTDINESVAHGLVQMTAVGTLSGEDGSADLQYVLVAARNIGRAMTEYKVIVDKSTVPVGTAEKVKQVVQEELDKRGITSLPRPQAREGWGEGAVNSSPCQGEDGRELPFSIVSNPEFLKESAAIDDVNRPDRIVIGAEDEQAIKVMRDMYAPFQRNHDSLIVMDIKSA